MGKIKAHGIAFEGAETFDAGSNIKGHVFVMLAQPLKVRGIRVLFRGSAVVEWRETVSEYDSANQRSRTRTVTYRATENYLNHSILLHGIRPNQGNSTIQMPPGHYKFPFTFRLPRTLPATFKGKYGCVAYHVESNIDLPWRLDPKSERPFAVRPIADLNLNPINRCGLSAENEKTLCCLCCASGPITATFRIEQQGFVPGQAIRIFSEISNDSDRIIDRTYVDLKRTATFYAQGRRRTETNVIARITRPSINAHGKDAWRGEPLTVPSTPPTGFPGCHIIHVEYQLKLNVDPSGLSLDLEIPFNINIGTIPVRQQQRTQPTAPRGNMPIDESLVNFAAATSKVASYNSIAPPYYEASPSAPFVEEGEAPPEYEVNPSAPPAESDQAPPSYEYAAAYPEDGEEGDEEDEHADSKSKSKGGYQRLS